VHQHNVRILGVNVFDITYFCLLIFAILGNFW
jgi:hypothetical protein